jgi:ADP-heptose:LPS heptosyltransferase
MRVLVSRTDRVGDAVLTLPLCALLTQELAADVIVLCRRYCRPVFEASRFVTEIVEWDSVPARARDQRQLLARAQADVILHLFPRPDIAWAAAGARIRARIGTSHRWYHWLTCTHLEHFSRKRSTLHEAQLNIRLARRLLHAAPSLETLSRLTTLHSCVPLAPEVEAFIDPTRLAVVLHPGSGGSGRQWPLTHWHDLAWSVDPSKIQLFVTGSREERAALDSWWATLPAYVIDLMGQLELPQLIALLAGVDGIVAAGTGPLHLAAALGRHALGLYPPTPPIHAGRWAPLGPAAESLTAPARCSARHRSRDECTCMEALSVAAVRKRIEAWEEARTTPLNPVQR